ncbi:hypothetical protein N7532_001750 [Penicillium argentinense]|uniref:Glycoside hydrolase family 92 protein n=1 Tax=Penicillium argentinense TaxID=1131581 RepID=A0A9W9G413_9EURO|nr:uncharacterized protein N7532_001750 [Penicillium argentinense]KAJ5111215.1 hypothetical protein N7532_001750 [Penicillium argentinense]
MHLHSFVPTLGILSLVSRPVTAFDEGLSQYVNPFIGSEGPDGTGFGGGDIFVGGARPFGVAKVGIDSTAANWSTAVLNGGWTPDGNVTGFSMMHESGTGGAPKYGLIAQMPLTTVQTPVNVLDNTTYSQARIGKDVAKVGYYKTRLQSGVDVELSASRHAGILEYSFPEGEKHILVDLSHVIPPCLPGDADGQFFAGGEIQIEEDGKSYSGYGTYVGGWNNGAPFTVYVYGEFNNTPDEAQTYSGVNTDPMSRSQGLANGGVSTPKFSNTTKTTSGPMNNRIGVLLSWNDGPAFRLASRVGISSISVERARSYIKDEISSWKLNDTVADAVKEWNEDVFNKVQVPLDDSANMTHVRLLYSSLYFMHLMPSDRTGENPLWDSGEPYWDDFYTMWDIFRCTVSFYHIFQPKYYESMIRSLIDIWKHAGFMPDGRSGNWNGLVQGGSDADNVLADAYVKGLRGSINWTEGYAAMVKDAEVTPYNTFDPTDFTASTKEGRGALDDWKELGYVSQDRNTRCISRTVEYSLNDFSLAQVAKGEKPGDVEKYLNRSAGWQNIWGENVQSLGFKGFLAPRLADGRFNDSGYDPLLCYGCEWSDYTYEAIPWEFNSVYGGDETFEARLDMMFKPNMSKQNLGANGAGITTLINIGNEPDFATPYLYNYINKQAKSVMQSRSLADQYFKDAAYGIPGNSDAGAMNSWLLWQMLGIYPIVTQPVYLLSSPWFPDLNMTINGDKTLRIRAYGLEEGFYVQGVKINGETWTRNWFEHADVMVEGGTIEFELGKEAKAWEKAEVPPSPGHVSLRR